MLSPPASAQVPLATSVLVVFNAKLADSRAVAEHYALQRGIPSANLCPIAPASTTILPWAQYVASVKLPIQDCLNAVGPDAILYIVFTYLTPYKLKVASNTSTYALDSYVADLWDAVSTGDSWPYPAKAHPYFDNAQAQGNVYRRFTSLDVYRATPGAQRIYSVWRLDAANVALAKGLVDKAVAAERAGLTGRACLDRNRGAIEVLADSGYGAGEWDLHRAADFLRQAGWEVTEDEQSAEFGSPGAPDCPNAALYAGWYSLDHYNDAFGWNPGAIGFHVDSASAVDPRGGTNWSANALLRGITVTSGAVAEPYLEGLSRAGGVFRDLLQGANVGDAFLRNTRWVKWRVLNIGDPLYRPFPAGLPPFNPPPPRASLGISTRVVLNGAATRATVTLASPASSGGAVIPLASSQPHLLSVPATVTIEPGQRKAEFTVQSAADPLVTAATPVKITASGVAQNTIAVVPLLGALFASPKTFVGGGSTTGWVFLNGKAPAGGAAVSLASNSAAALVPARVVVPRGASQASFTVQSSVVGTATTVVVSASRNGALVTTKLVVEPPP